MDSNEVKSFPKRGDVFYICKDPVVEAVGSEQQAGRPAVVVSNDMNNEYSGVIEVCFFTLQRKNHLPTHVFVGNGPCHHSTILCEQVTSISKDRVDDYLCTLSEETMKKVDRAIQISLGLVPEKVSTLPEPSNPEEAIYKTLYYELIDRLFNQRSNS